MMRVYVDTCVYLDYFFDRSDKLRPLGDLANSAFLYIKEKKFTVVFSDWTRTQLKMEGVNDSDIDELLSDFPEIVSVVVTSEDKKEAKNYPDQNDDGMHGVLACKHGCVALLTRDAEGYVSFLKTLRILPPELFSLFF